VQVSPQHAAADFARRVQQVVVVVPVVESYTMTNTYLYIRYSDAKQDDGTSYDRQLEKARAYCADKKLVFVEDNAHVFFDAGKSAYKGEHLAEGGELKRFYDLVADHTIPSGSKLLVEDLDRLSRQTMWKASDKFRELTDAGMVVITLRDRKEWTGRGGFGDAMQALMMMDLSNQESAKKSDRVGASWTLRYKKARMGEPIKIPLASWLTYGKDGMTVLKEPEAGAVRLIFEMCIAGHGMIVIAKALTAQGYKPFRGAKWITASVFCIVKNKAAMGVYTPRDGGMAVDNYFAAVVDSEVWFEAQDAIKARAKAKATRQTKTFNVWQGIAKCWHCNSALHCLPKGKNKIHYLVCSGKIAGICTKAKNTRSDESEEVFKELLAQVDSLSLVQEDKAQTAKELRVLEGMLEEQCQRKDRMVAIFNDDPTVEVNKLIKDAGITIANLTEQKAAAEKKLTQERLAEKDKSWFLDKLDLVSYDKRGQANALLKRLEITVSVSGGKRSTYVARKGNIEDNNQGYPHPGGRAILQISDTEEGVIVIPLTTDQRAKNAELDPDGTDRAKANKWVRKSLGLDKNK